MMSTSPSPRDSVRKPRNLSPLAIPTALEPLEAPQDEAISPILDENGAAGALQTVDDDGLGLTEAGRAGAVSPIQSEHEDGVPEHVLETSALMGVDRAKADEIVPQMNASVDSKPSLFEPRPRIPTWIPLSLTYCYLLTVAGISFALGIICIILEVKSRAGNGISNAGTGNGFAFSWRFLPTILAVVYSLFWAPVMTDTVRTDPWALMSIPGGSRGSESLLKTPELWIIEAYKSVWKRKAQPGGIRWGVFLAICASMIGSLTVNPLSAGLLNVQDMAFVRSQAFLSLAKSNSAPVSDVSDSIYLASIAQLVYNLTTSAWLTADYAVMPFWPSSDSNLQSIPTGAQLALSPQVWNGTSSVFKLDFDCQLLAPSMYQTLQTTASYVINIDINIPGGCSGTISIGGNSLQDGSAGVNMIASGLAQWGVFNNTDSCKWHDYILLIPPSIVNTTNPGPISFPGAGPQVHVCSSLYSVANLPISILTSTANSTISINDGTFNASKQQMDSSFLNIDDFQKSFGSETGSYDLTYFTQFSNESTLFAGPSMALFLRYNSSLTNMLAARDLAQRAQIVKQSFFGQTLLASFSSLAEAQNTAQVSGLISTTSSRLVIVNGFGFSLGAILIVLGVVAVLLPRLTNPRRRPLQLEHDPSTAAAAALLLEGSETQKCFETLDSQSGRALEQKLGHLVFEMAGGNLTLNDSIQHHAPADQLSSPKHGIKSKKLDIPGARQQVDDWRPFGLRFWAATSFVVILLLTVGALIAIYVVATLSGLYESAFVYQKNLSLAGYDITTLAPLNVVPTLIATIIKLWWAFFDDTFRRLTPFLSMVRNPSKPEYGPALSYISTPLLWVTAMAAKKRHWVLALVTLGAFTSEVLQVTMSALWTAEPGVLTRNIIVNQEREVRTVAQVFNESKPGGGMGGYHPLDVAVFMALYGSRSALYDDWMYHALVQTTANATRPAFSTAQWGFSPLDFDNVVGQVPVAKQANQGGPNTILGPNLNVTYPSPALSGRLECVSLNKTFSHKLFSPIDSGYTLQENYISFVGLNPNADSSNPSNFSLGMWTQDLTVTYDSEAEPGKSFSVVWFNSNVPQHQTLDGQSYWVFADIPPVTAVKCDVVFEKATAQVTIDVFDKSIQAYELLTSPQDASEAWSDYYVHHYSTPASLGRDDQYYNQTVSWGYLFMKAVLGASIGGLTSEYKVGFTFRESNLYADFFSYVAYAMADYDPIALEDPTVLASLSSMAFSQFFQAWISIPNTYDGGYWAWQPVNTTVPYGLDFETPLETTIYSTQNLTSIVSSCEATATTVCTPITSFVTWRILTDPETVYPPTTGPGITFGGWPSELYNTIMTPTAISSSQAAPTVVPTPASISVSPLSVFRRQATPTPTSTTSTPISATLSIRTQMLIVSPVALWFSVAILLFLAVSTIFAFVEQRRYIKLLPRDVESPASILAFVYASKKLQAWARERHERGQWDDSDGSGISLARFKEILAKSKTEKDLNDVIEVGMGSFPPADSSHWGVEIDAAPARMSLLHPESLSSYASKWQDEQSDESLQRSKAESSSASAALLHSPHLA